MSIFKEKLQSNLFDESILVKTPTTGSFISKCFSNSGDIKSCEPIVIEGRVNGNIRCEDIVVVLKGAIVKGNIEAKEIRVDSIVEGNLKANVIQTTNSSSVIGDIKSNIATIAGSLKGNIEATESLEIAYDTDVESFICKSNIITVAGSFKGSIEAVKLLDIKSSGKVKGNIMAKNIISETGCTIIGSVNNYNKPIIENKNHIKETKVAKRVS